MALKLPCYCASLRQATRAISQEYDRAMRPLNLTGTQFTLLRMLNELPSARVNDLAEALAMDQTTVSRTLALIKDAKLIERQAGEDRREARWVLTAAGRKKLREGSPLWESARCSPAARKSPRHRPNPVRSRRFELQRMVTLPR